jgi:DNA polymerase V
MPNKGWLLKKMYRPEVYYQKLGELVPKAAQQMDLYAYSSSNKSGRLMNVVDRINGKYRRARAKARAAP